VCCCVGEWRVTGSVLLYVRVGGLNDRLQRSINYGRYICTLHVTLLDY